MSDLLTFPLHLKQPINNYNNNNNNKEKELGFLSQSGHSSYHIYIYKCIFFFFPASAADHRSLLA